MPSSTDPSAPTAPREVDVAVVGGGAAGLAAALQLGRSRRSVVVVDGGAPRNAPAAHLHGYLGFDGRPPADLVRAGREEVADHGVELVEGLVVAATREDGGGFSVALADGRRVRARRLVLATGLVDELPDIPGVAERWGRDVLHCPYCHGWEVRDRELVVLATTAMAGHQALLFRQLSDRVTVVHHGGPGITDEERPGLAALGVRMVDGPVEAVVVEGDAVTGVRLAGGRVLPADAVVVAPRFVARTTGLDGLGLTPVPAPMGTGLVLEVDAMGATGTPGVYAAGNVADASAQLLQAAAQGSRVGAVVNADLAREDAARALAAHPGDDRAGWDRRFAAAPQLFSGNVNASLVAEVDGLPPGRALDVGCGEGADAVWLARHGWDATGLDLSPVALERAATAADAAGVAVRWVAGDVAAGLDDERFDLVTAHYLALRRTPDEVEVDRLVGAVAPGGVLLVVGHDVEAMRSHTGAHGFDPDAYVQPADVARHLGEGWTIEVSEHRPRVPPPGREDHHVDDVVLRARRAG